MVNHRQEADLGVLVCVVWICNFRNAPDFAALSVSFLYRSVSPTGQTGQYGAPLGEAPRPTPSHLSQLGLQPVGSEIITGVMLVMQALTQKGQELVPSLVCTKFRVNPSGYGRPRYRLRTSMSTSLFSCGHVDGEKLFDHAGT